MSQENVEVLYRMAAAASERDLATFLEVTDPTVEWHTALSVVAEGGAYHGHEGVRQYVRDLEEAYQTFEVTLDDVRAAGEIAVALGSVSLRGRASGIEQTAKLGWVVRFRDGKAVHLKAFRNPEDALEAAGLSE